MMKNLKCNIHRLCLILSLCSSAPIVAGQTQKVNGSQFINFPDSPLVLEEFGKTFQVRNISSQTIVRFTLACTASKGKRNIAILIFPAHEPTLSPGGAAPEIRVDAPSSLSLCVSRKAKLAVIDAVFSNGDQWHAPVQQAPAKSSGSS
jgi:hypothetical protein